MICGCVLVASTGKARAQDLFDRSENVAVRDRPRPEYEAQGIHAGGFLVYPKLTLGVTYNDNILATDTDPLADEIFTIAPRVDVQSNWNRNAVNLSASAIILRYANHPDQDSIQYDFSGGGDLDVRHDLTLSGKASYARILIPRSADVEFSVTPLLYDEGQAEIGLFKDFNRLKLTVDGRYQAYAYEDGRDTDGQPIDESFQNRQTEIGDLRLDYALSPEFAVFFEEKLSGSEYHRASYRDQFSTDTILGPNFEITRLITAEIGIGYLTSSFSDPNAGTVGTFHFRGKVLYFPTQLITVTFTGDRGVFDSGIPTSPAYVSTIANLQADYELLRNLIITARVEGVWNDYRVIDKHDRFLGGRLSMTYLANRGLGIELALNHLKRRSDTAGAVRWMSDDEVSLAITLQH
jgi:hypothetical protein